MEEEVQIDTYFYREPLDYCANCGKALFGGDYKVSDDDKWYCLACIDVEGADELLECHF